MDEIMETELVEKEQETAVETQEKCCGNCERMLWLQEEGVKIIAENNKLREELEQMKKLPRFSVKTVADKSGMDAVRSIFRKHYPNSPLNH